MTTHGCAKAGTWDERVYTSVLLRAPVLPGMSGVAMIPMLRMFFELRVTAQVLAVVGTIPAKRSACPNPRLPSFWFWLRSTGELFTGTPFSQGPHQASAFYTKHRTLDPDQIKPILVMVKVKLRNSTMKDVRVLVRYTKASVIPLITHTKKETKIVFLVMRSSSHRVPAHVAQESSHN